eukprot:scaffold6219_cov106-Skeletonema_dohrnii-CCMP3373.AAC.6
MVTSSTINSSRGMSEAKGKGKREARRRGGTRDRGPEDTGHLRRIKKRREERERKPKDPLLSEDEILHACSLLVAMNVSKTGQSKDRYNN